jgi:SpoVK/Ycf46/Vps4 family AAA+-type ATPase
MLWDNDADGTFDSLSSYLVGMPAREIGYLRQKFAPRWERAMKNTISDDLPSPVDVLQSLLPDLETARSFTQSSGKGGGSSTLPLSSSSLPNVRWEDIGGLEAIRKEIMDAVELPLKYPALFEGSRISDLPAPVKLSLLRRSRESAAYPSFPSKDLSSSVLTSAKARRTFAQSLMRHVPLP